MVDNNSTNDGPYNESTMENTLSFEEVAKIVGVHIKMDTSKEKVINVHIKNGKFIHFKACAESLFYTNRYYPSIITHPTYVSDNSYSYLSNVLKTLFFY